MKGKISHDCLPDDLGHIYLILIDQNANLTLTYVKMLKVIL